MGGGTATSGTDYAEVSDFTVTIPRESASGSGTFTLTPTQDDIAEGDETIDITGAADGFTVTKAEMTLTRRRDGAGLDHADRLAHFAWGGRRRNDGHRHRHPGRQRDAPHRHRGDSLGGRRHGDLGDGLRGGIGLHGDDPEGERERERGRSP